MNLFVEKLEEIQAALEIGQTAITELYKENGELKAEIERLREALQSIADNTCCNNCQEAAKWAKAALNIPDRGENVTVLTPET